jgi:hypothetical protein
MHASSKFSVHKDMGELGQACIESWEIFGRQAGDVPIGSCKLVQLLLLLVGLEGTRYLRQQDR